MHRLTSAIDRLSAGVGLLGATLVIPLALIMSYEVLARYLLDLPTFWAYEFAYMLTGSHFALGIALVTLKAQHIRVDFLHAHFPRRVQAAIDLAVLVLALLPVVAWTSWGLLDYAWDSYRLDELSGESAWNPLVWPVKLTIAMGFVFFSLQLFAEIIKAAACVFGRAEGVDP